VSDLKAVQDNARTKALQLCTYIMQLGINNREHIAPYVKELRSLLDKEQNPVDAVGGLDRAAWEHLRALVEGLERSEHLGMLLRITIHDLNHPRFG
jgi:hypothetical protein